MQNLKDLMEKYGNVTAENGLMDGVEVDMDPTVGVVETLAVLFVLTGSALKPVILAVFV